MKLTNNFTLKELTYSQYAADKKIDNKFDFEIVDNLLELCETFLQPFRDYYGKPIKVTSGYRSEELNKQLAGASNTSVHPLGLAVDILPASGDFKSFVGQIKAFIKEKNPAFDQVLIEKSGSSQWVHIGIRNRKGQQRKQIKDLVV